MSSITQELPRAIGVPLDWSLSIFKAIVIFSGLLMAVTFFLVVVIRYGFQGDLYAYEEWLLAVSFWGFFAGAVLASERKLHVNADILGIVITSPRAFWWRQTIVLTVELVVTLAIVYWAYLMVADEFSYYPRWKMTPALKIPYVSWRIGILIAFSYMSIFSAAYLYVHLKGGMKDIKPEQEDAQ